MQGYRCHEGRYTGEQRPWHVPHRDVQTDMQLAVCVVHPLTNKGMPDIPMAPWILLCLCEYHGPVWPWMVTTHHHKQSNKQQVVVRLWWKENPSALLGMQTGSATVETSMEFPENTKNGNIFWPSKSTAGIIPYDSWNTNSNEPLHHNVHRSTIYNSQVLGAT